MKKISKIYMRNKKNEVSTNKLTLSSFFTSILKFSLAIALLIILTFFVTAGDVIVESGKLDVDSKLFVDDAGNVGIGTASPGYKLDVSGPNSDAVLNLHSSSGSIRFYPYSSNVNYIQSGNEAWNANQLLQFEGYGGNAGTFNFNGNVGIGTTDPGTHKLNVEGSIGGFGGNIVAARAICYGGVGSNLAGGSFSIIMRKYSPGTSLETTCNGINAGWHACGVAKSNYVSQNCDDLSNTYYDAGYTSFVKATEAQGYINGGSYSACDANNMIVCCSISCSGW